MSDKAIGELSQATGVTPSDKFVLEQDGVAKCLDGRTLELWLMSMADGHGGIRDIQKTGTSGLVDTYTIQYADENTTSFTVTNGERGPQGLKGDTGDASVVTSITTAFAESINGVNRPSSGWSEQVPTVPPGHFLWTRTTVNFNNGRPAVIYTASKHGENGISLTSSVRNVGDSGLSFTDSSEKVAIVKQINSKHPDENGLVSLVPSDIGAVSKRSVSIVIPSTGWTNKQQTVSATGVKTTSDVFVSPAPSSLVSYAESFVRCVAQGNGNLTFVCEDIPEDNLTVNIAIFD